MIAKALAWSVSWLLVLGIGLAGAGIWTYSGWLREAVAQADEVLAVMVVASLACVSVVLAVSRWLAGRRWVSKHVVGLAAVVLFLLPAVLWYLSRSTVAGPDASPWAKWAWLLAGAFPLYLVGRVLGLVGLAARWVLFESAAQGGDPGMDPLPFQGRWLDRLCRHVSRPGGMPLLIAMKGTWGQGKSALVRMMGVQLRSRWKRGACGKDEPVVLVFDLWTHEMEP
ncbi:MAG: hypothetical protein FJ087_06745, partial [Deltaproteobacteria bacterium]|nr:hypothetical protein [Deltaproteobacteria bacterium]